jgi:hypothetical protein
MGAWNRLVEHVDQHEGFFLVLFTALLVVVTGFLWNATRLLAADAKTAAARQAADTLEALAISRQSADAATKAADAAKASVDAVAAGDRAYVYVNKNDTRRHNAEQGALTPLDKTRPIAFGNYGRTPAELVSYLAYVQYWLGKKLEPGGDQPVHGIWLAPGWTSAPFLVQMDAKAEEIERAQNGDGDIALIGRVKYRDVFGDCHETGFCLLWDFSTHNLTLAPGEGLNYNRKVDC